MPKPLVKGGGAVPAALFAAPGNKPANAAGFAPKKVSTLEELAVLERVTVGEDERPRLKKPMATDDDDDAPVAKPAASMFAKPAAAPAPAPAAASKSAAAPAPAAAAASVPQFIEVEEEIEETVEEDPAPDSIAEGWAPMADEEGDIFYYCEATQEAKWEHPGLGPKVVRTITKTVKKTIPNPAYKAPAPAPAPAPAAAAKAASAPAPAPAAATKSWQSKTASSSTATKAAAPAPAPAPASAARTAAPAAAGADDDETCDAFEPNPFKKDMCKKCRKKKEKHAA